VAAPADSSETFRNAWFSDPDAIPQVLLWGLVLTAVWVGIYLISRRLRSYWIGIPIGFVPFVVVLYFFFENVNRLLPPNL
jgi:sortase A